MRRTATTLAACAAAAVFMLTGCGGGSGGGGGGTDKAGATPSAPAGSSAPAATDTAGDTPSATPTQVLAQIKGDSGMEVTITSAVRDSGGFVTVQGTLTNQGDQPFTASYWRGTEMALVPSGPSVAGAVLVDEAGKKRYYVLRDTGGTCLCTTGLLLIQPQESRPFFAQFPAPPAGTTQVDFELPTMPPAKITISQG
jgi:hypothetical protein